ncbi:MAG TPA: nitrogenase component 1 [Spirochaetia bacterium]|nr:nitrogenase component 1 [Spirochaetia bacterium]
MNRPYVATTNPCKLCTPLGAALAFHGVEGAMCLLHGSQGCSTYIRRYLISHFKEPLDVASTNFTEHSAVFGGRENFLTAVANLARQYQPRLIGVATTCLAETMGEDLGLFLHELRSQPGAEALPPVVPVSTAAYRGTHADGFFDAVHSLFTRLADPAAEGPGPGVVVLAPMVSPADLRTLKADLGAFGLAGALVPDWSDTLDGGPWEDYTPLPAGGTPLEVFRTAPRARAWVELGVLLPREPHSVGEDLEARFGVPGRRLPWPLGVRATDSWYAHLSSLSGRPVPADLVATRARLVDSLVDGHKVVSGLRVAVFGEEDLVVALAGFLAEIGAKTVAAASGGTSGRLAETLAQVLGPEADPVRVVEDGDFFDLERRLEGEEVDLLIGPSKGFKLARLLKVPLVRVGFPVHDRFGGARIRLLGYPGTQDLFDRIVNAVLEHRQESNPAGYTYY